MKKKKLFSPAPKDERLSAQLGEIYRVGFYILALGILFDLYTQYNYLAQSGSGDGAFVQSPIEFIVLVVACVVVGAICAKRGVYSDSLRFAEARTFGETGLVASSLGLAAVMAVAAVGGRLYNEVILFGWGEVTWAGDAAMLVFMLVMFSCLILAVQYAGWRSYRAREDRLAQEERDD